jgi:hypothetical protein
MRDTKGPVQVVLEGLDEANDQNGSKECSQR